MSLSNDNSTSKVADHPSGKAAGGKVKQDKRWDERFKQLEKFKNENGHCYVPSSNKNLSQLCTWVRHQRHLYKLNMKGIPSSLTHERMNKLDSIGFVWDVVSYDPTWNTNFQELQKFKNKHGHCNVTLRKEQYKKLAKWVMNQRRAYRENRLVMLGDRKAKLDSIDFEWFRHKYTWEDSFEQLKKFKEAHGHDDPPMDSKEHRRLRIWVQNQRTMFKLKKSGKKTWITKERIKKLESINFNWKRKKSSITENVGKDETDSLYPLWVCHRCHPSQAFQTTSFICLLSHEATQHG